MAAEPRSFFARQAWVGGAWAKDVVLRAGEDGLWSEVTVGAVAPAGAQLLQGPVLPGLVNAHSHAFQRAIAGMTERSAAGQDDFWSWRDRMYSAALRITPAQLEAVATYLYSELLACGYTQVCEFHYLHNDESGKAYADASEMSLALVRAARHVGIGLTLLPTLYMRSGFGAKGLRQDQCRFASTLESILKIVESVESAARRDSDVGLLRAGVALHSLRAVPEAALTDIASAARGRMPVHIHVAEQQQEVDDCMTHTGQRPIEWLLRNAALDAGWNLVHATQTTSDELAGVRTANASIVICPSTEANLGDGVFDLPGWLGQGGAWSIGSDSHVTRDWREELRLLEYSQRLTLRQRNIAARSGRMESSATALFEGALRGGSAAAGLPLGGIAIGQRADFMVLNPDSPALLGVPADHVLDAVIFSSGTAVIGSVHIACRAVSHSDISGGFVRAMRSLWA